MAGPPLTTPAVLLRKAAAGDAAGPLLRGVHRRLSEAARWLTTPLMPDDFLELLNPLCSSEHLRGRVLSVQPETSDAATLVVQPGRGWCGYRAGSTAGSAHGCGATGSASCFSPCATATVSFSARFPTTSGSLA